MKDRESGVCYSPWSHRVGRDLATEQQLVGHSRNTFFPSWLQSRATVSFKASGGAGEAVSEVPVFGGISPMFTDADPWANWLVWAGHSGGKQNGPFRPLCFDHCNSDEVVL